MKSGQAVERHAWCLQIVLKKKEELFSILKICYNPMLQQEEYKSSSACILFDWKKYMKDKLEMAHSY